MTKTSLERRHDAQLAAVQRENLAKNLGVTTSDTRTLVEDCYSLNVSEARRAFERGPDPRGWSALHKLDEWELSNPPWRETYSLTARGPIYSDQPFGAPVNVEAWHLNYEERLLAVQLPGGHIDEVGWEELPWAFGGVRRWWLCPYCYRRCSKLYSLPRWSCGLGCRSCLRLAYSLENKSKVSRAIERYWRQANRHGIRDGETGVYFDRPKGQHLDGYIRDLNRLRELDYWSWIAIARIQRVRF